MEKVMILATPADIAEGLRMFLAENSAQKTNPEKLHTISQTHRLLGKSYSTVVRMIKDGRIEATLDGKNISQKSIDRYLTAKP